MIGMLQFPLLVPCLEFIVAVSFPYFSISAVLVLATVALRSTYRTMCRNVPILHSSIQFTESYCDYYCQRLPGTYSYLGRAIIRTKEYSRMSGRFVLRKSSQCPLISDVTPGIQRLYSKVKAEERRRFLKAGNSDTFTNGIKVVF